MFKSLLETTIDDRNFFNGVSYDLFVDATKFGAQLVFPLSLFFFFFLFFFFLVHNFLALNACGEHVYIYYLPYYYLSSYILLPLWVVKLQDCLHFTKRYCPGERRKSSYSFSLSSYGQKLGRLGYLTLVLQPFMEKENWIKTSYRLGYEWASSGYSSPRHTTSVMPWQSN